MYGRSACIAVLCQRWQNIGMHCPGSIVKVSSQEPQSEMQREMADLTSKVCMQAGQRCVKGYKLCITFRSLKSPLLTELHSRYTSAVQWLLLVRTLLM